MATLLSRVQRGPGTLDTGQRDVPGGVDTDTNYVFTGLMNAAELEDSTLTLSMQLWLDDQLVRDEVWVGGVLDKNGQPVPPNIAYSTGALVPSTFRATVTLPRRIPFGVDVSTGLRR